MLPALPAQYKLAIYVVAYGKQGSTITSNVVNPYVSKGAGTYVKVTPTGYSVPIMKRALAIANAPTPDALTAVILDKEGNPAQLLDNDANTIQPVVASVLSSDTWSVMQEGYAKDADGTWKANDIKFEILVDLAGGIITDNTNLPIYVL